MKYVVYYRVSTKRQGESGLGLDAQKRDIEIFFESYAKDGEVVAEFTDIQSGSNDNRPNFQEAVKLCKEQGCTLLVAKLDRVSRKVSTIATLMEEISLKVACMPSADNFQLHIYAALAEQERTFISQRTKAALAQAKAKGTKIGGGTIKHKVARQKGYKKLVERDQHYVSKLQAFRNKGYTMERIADVFNDMGYTTPKGCQHNKSSVYRLCCKYGIV